MKKYLFLFGMASLFASKGISQSYKISENKRELDSVARVYKISGACGLSKTVVDTRESWIIFWRDENGEMNDEMIFTRDLLNERDSILTLDETLSQLKPFENTFEEIGTPIYCENSLVGMIFRSTIRVKKFFLVKILKPGCFAIQGTRTEADVYRYSGLIPIDWWYLNVQGQPTYDQIEYIKQKFLQYVK